MKLFIIKFEGFEIIGITNTEQKIHPPTMVLMRLEIFLVSKKVKREILRIIKPDITLIKILISSEGYKNPEITTHNPRILVNLIFHIFFVF